MLQCSPSHVERSIEAPASSPSVPRRSRAASPAPPPSEPRDFAAEVLSLRQTASEQRALFREQAEVIAGLHALNEANQERLNALERELRACTLDEVKSDPPARPAPRREPARVGAVPRAALAQGLRLQERVLGVAARMSCDDLLTPDAGRPNRFLFGSRTIVVKTRGKELLVRQGHGQGDRPLHEVLAECMREELSAGSARLSPSCAS